MKKIILVLSILLSFSALADNKISNELVTVKACQQAVSEKLFDLSNVYDASVDDSGKMLTVELRYKNGDADCKYWSWFKYDGTNTVCEPCQELGNNQSCACASGMCAYTDGTTKKQYLDINP